MGRQHTSKMWAKIISTFAARACFFIIIAQLPLFRFPCRIGTCETPIDIMACQLITSGNFPNVVLKGLLYPGVIKRLFTQWAAIPSPDQLLNSYKSKMRDSPSTSDLKHLEVIAGSYLCVAGALLGLIKHGRMSLLGLTLILWGILRERFSHKHASCHSKTASVYPEMIITIILAFFSVKRDVRRLMRICKPDHIFKRLKKFFIAKNI